jgi:2-keto-4-pentenoate hydratase/2-oxohepta-3-ene-1,7-dioic acid hydratase in catechol pathway
MKFVRYATHGTASWGVLNDGEVHELGQLPAGDPSIADVGNGSYVNTVARAVERGSAPTVAVEEVSLLAPVAEPGKIVCVGLNYHDHAEEQDEDVPGSPLLFGKAPTSVANPGEPIVHPAGIEEVDYEVELGVVIGRTASAVSAEDALDHVAGYTVVNDVSARDAQFEDEQFFRGKSYDTFAPMGPTLVAESALDPNDLRVETRVDGETKQSSTTAEFIFTVEELVAYISRAMTLRPGDVISTGTPGGVGIFRDPPELLEPGDVVEVEIEGIGTLENPVASAE